METGRNPANPGRPDSLRTYGLFNWSGALLAGLLACGVHADTALSPGHSAAYYDPSRTGEGLFVELLTDGRALVYMFSYAPASAPGGSSQSWMLGVGRLVEGGIRVDRMQRPTGGRFGPPFDPDQVDYQTIGSLNFRFPTCGTSAERGSLHIDPRDGTGFDELTSDNYVQLSTVLDCETYEASEWFFLSGSWHDPDRTGEGLILEVLKDGRGLVQWFTYDNLGRQMWIQGLGAFTDYKVLTVEELFTFGGAHWGADFSPAAVSSSPFGSLKIEFVGCDTATMHYLSPQFGSGTHELKRFTDLWGIHESGAGCWDY